MTAFAQDQAGLDKSFEWTLQELRKCDSSLDMVVLPEFSEVPGKTSYEGFLETVHRYGPTLLDECARTARRCSTLVFVGAIDTSWEVPRNALFIFGRDGSLLGKYAVSLGKKTGVPVVATFHSKVYDAILEFTKSRMVAKAATDRIVRLYERCDEVWACSEETGETLRSYGYRKPYFVMPNGTDVTVPGNTREMKETAESRFQLPEDKHILLFVGQQIWYKNQRLILDTFRLLRDRSDEWFLVMAGSGKDEQDIARYSAALNLSDRVCFTGLIKDRDLLRGLYLASDLLFFPSVFDNAPLVLREAAVLGVPTLAVEGSNAAGAIRKNVSGFTAAATPEAMRDEIIRIFGTGNIREIGKNAQAMIPVSWEKLIPMVLERYRTVIERYGKTR